MARLGLGRSAAACAIAIPLVLGARASAADEPPTPPPTTTGSAPAPAVSPTLSPDAQAGEPAANDAPPEPTPIDVTVREAPKPPDVVSLSRAEARLVPGTFGDPFRVVEALPGVVPLASGVPYFYVRGAPPGNVGYFLDGVRVPLLYHLGLGPSVVHPALIDHVELHAGGDPTIGRFAGGAVTADLVEPRDDFHGEANVRIIDAGAFVEVPFDHGKGSAMAAGRYSYTAPLFTLLKSDTVLTYGDYAARVSYAFTPKHRLSGFAFGAYDYLGQKDFTPYPALLGRLLGDQPTNTLFDTTFHRLDVRYDQRVDDRTTLRHDVILGWDETHLDQGRDVVDRMIALKSQMKHAVSDDLELRAGIDLTLDSFKSDLDRGDQGEQQFTSFFTSRLDTALGVYEQLAMRLGPLEAVPSIRIDLFTSGSRAAYGVDPSLALRLPLTKEVALTTSHGLSSQPPSFIVSGPGFRPPLDDHGLQHTFMSSAGVEWTPDASWILKAAVYRATFFAINDALGTSTLATQGFPDGLGGFNERYDGWSTGIELSLKRRLTKRLGAIVSYTIGRSERYGPHGERVPSGFDRTHVASAALSYDFGKGWRGGVRNLFYSGTPVLDRVEPAGSTDPSAARIVDTGRRQTPFFRTDLRIEKRWKIRETGHVSVILEMLNAFVAKEVVGTKCAPSGVCDETKIGPVAVPSLGVEGGF